MPRETPGDEFLLSDSLNQVGISDEVLEEGKTLHNLARANALIASTLDNWLIKAYISK
jgi:hypothetical protein